MRAAIGRINAMLHSSKCNSPDNCASLPAVNFSAISLKLRRRLTIFASHQLPSSLLSLRNGSRMETMIMITTVPFIGVAAGRASLASPSRPFRLLAAATAGLLWLPRFWRARSKLAALAQ